MREEVRKYALGTFKYLGVLGIGALIGLTIKSTPMKEVFVRENRPLNDWEKMKMALIKTECEWDSLAVGKAKDSGIYQITPIYVEEVNRLLKEERYTLDDALIPPKAEEMFTIMQEHRNPNKDIDKAIQLHNPRGGQHYMDKVKKNIEFIETYERYRSIIK